MRSRPPRAREQSLRPRCDPWSLDEVSATEQDPGDEHRDPSPRDLTGIDKLLAEWGDPPLLDTVSAYWDVREMVMHLECIQDCCSACSDDLRGVEDGA